MLKDNAILRHQARAGSQRNLHTSQQSSSPQKRGGAFGTSRSIVGSGIRAYQLSPVTGEESDRWMMNCADGEKVVMQDYVFKKQRGELSKVEQEVEETKQKIQYAEHYNV